MKRILPLICILLLFQVSLRAQVADREPDAVLKKTTAPFAQDKFVPDIALILDFTCITRSLKNEDYRKLSLPAFVPRNGDGASVRGFNLNYGELNIASTVDPYFDLSANIALEEEGIEIEEAFMVTRSLPLGFTAKTGKFLSSFGRINSQHEHCWEFTDKPLILEATFGEALNEKGIQVNFVMPVDFYCMVGMEILQGENESAFGFEKLELCDPSGNNLGHTTSGEAPNCYIGYIKSSFDIGNLVVLGGLSAAWGKSRTSIYGNPFTGETLVAGADLFIKYMLDCHRHVSLQGEFIYRQSGGKTHVYNGGTSSFDRWKTDYVLSGFYSQVAFKFSKRWRLGLRGETVLRNDIEHDESVSFYRTPDNAVKYSAMAEFNPTEFSRIRFQYNHDRAHLLENRKKINHEWILQFNMAIGAHGAHPL